MKARSSGSFADGYSAAIEDFSALLDNRIQAGFGTSARDTLIAVKRWLLASIVTRQKELQANRS